jgi:hypothetical protein
LITGVCIGLFCYVNSYFAIRLHKVVDGSIIRDDTDIFSCDNYYCDRTLYNYMYYYSFYIQCNNQICSNICGSYVSSGQCNNDQYYINFNRYYACQPGCPGFIKSNYPKIMYLAYALSLSAAVCFGLNLLVHIFMGIVLNIKSR